MPCLEGSGTSTVTGINIWIIIYFLKIKKGNFQTLKIIYRFAKPSKIARKDSKCNFLPVLKCENQSEKFTFDCAKISEKLQFVSFYLFLNPSKK